MGQPVATFHDFVFFIYSQGIGTYDGCGGEGGWNQTFIQIMLCNAQLLIGCVSGHKKHGAIRLAVHRGTRGNKMAWDGPGNMFFFFLFLVPP